MAKLEGILFDLDGLLIDSEKVYHRVSYEMARALNVELHNGILAQQMGRSPLESMEIFKRELGIYKFSAQALVDWRDRLMLKSYREGVELMPGAMEVLETTAKEYKTAIATGSTRNLVEVVAEQLSLGKYMNVILPSDEITKGKPNPEIYLTAAKLLALPVENCLVLEDSSNGCKAGLAAGCRVIAVPNEHTINQDFSNVDYVATNLLDAYQFIVKTYPSGS